MKAFCLAFSFLMLIVPAHAGDVFAPPGWAQIDDTDTSGAYRSAWLHKKIELVESAVAESRSSEAAFDAKVRAMLASVREKVRRAAAGPNPTNIRVRVRCVTKRIVLVGDAPRPFVPALAWSAQTTAPKQEVVGKVFKACAIKLYRKRATARATHMQHYEVKLPLLAPTAQ